MWLLNFIPDFVFHILVIASVLGILASEFFGFLLRGYAVQVRLVSIILLVFGIFMEGAIFNQSAWETKVLEAENKVLELQVESEKTNTKLAEALKNNELLRKDRRYETKTIIKNEVARHDGSCVLSNAFIRVHDSSSQDQVPERARFDDGEPSGVKPSEALDTISDNYKTCYDIRDKLISWQEWYKKQSSIFEGS